MSNIVPVKKVAFGSPEFMFLRRDIDTLIQERNSLTYVYNYSEDAPKRYNWLQRTIRLLADNVYFVRKPRPVKQTVPQFTVPDMNDADAYAKYLREKKQKKNTKPAKQIKPTNPNAKAMQRNNDTQGELF